MIIVSTIGISYKQKQTNTMLTIKRARLRLALPTPANTVMTSSGGQALSALNWEPTRWRPATIAAVLAGLLAIGAWNTGLWFAEYCCCYYRGYPVSEGVVFPPGHFTVEGV